MLRGESYSSMTRTAAVSFMAAMLILPSGHTAPIPDLPAQIYFKTVGLPSGRVTEYRLGKEGMLRRVVHLRGTVKEKKRKVTAVSWRRFQEQVLPLRLGEWKNEYVNPKQIFDGLSWTLHFQMDGIDSTSTGREMGPAATDPSKSVELTYPACGAAVLLKAFERLWGAD
jgi:hypothetical protein